jgi:hypothetical protein
LNSCASLFEVSPTGEETWVCDTPVAPDGAYNFALADKSYFSGKNLKVSVNTFKGQPRAVMTSVGTIASDVALDIGTDTTIQSIYRSEALKSGKAWGSQDASKLVRDLKSMCPATVTDDNADSVVKNAIGYLAGKASRTLLVSYRDLADVGGDASGLATDIATLCSYLDGVVAEIDSGSSELRLTDKEGVPYANLRFWLAQNSGSLSDSGATGAFYTTDADGFIDITALADGGYTFILADATTGADNFLWASNWKYAGHIEKYPGISIFQMDLPRVLIFEKSANSSAPFLAGPFRQYYAQSFSLAQGMSFCGIGFGMGLGGLGSPTTLQIRADSGGSPAADVLFESPVLRFTGAVSYGREAGFASVCDTLSEPAALAAGTYWVVAYYATPPAQVAVLGDAQPPVNGIPFMASDDGAAWGNFMPAVEWNGSAVGWAKLEFYLTQ